MKKTFYIIFTSILGLLLSFIIHAMVEIIYLNYAQKNNLIITWTFVFDQKACALPLWLIYLLLVLGIIFGIWLGFFWWKKVYKK